MLRKLLKISFILGGVVLVVFFIAIVALVAYVPGSDKDRLVREAASPDRQVVAEIHNVITPMWGGPDRVEVRLRHPGDINGRVVYSQMFECSNFAAFQLKWIRPQELEVTMNDCDSGNFNGIPGNSITRQFSEWQGISIAYIHLAPAPRISPEDYRSGKDRE